MRFIDEAKITIISGQGGDGCSSFRREKFIPFGGPDGGDGGSGGKVYFQATRDLNTLVKFRGKKIYRAQNGENGKGSQCCGKSGEDLIIQVPVGTIIKNLQSNEIMTDLSTPDELVLILNGGEGGFGNMNFKSSINQAPDKATTGRDSQELEILLELKILADIALVGLPNAGKSTLISVISAAKPKIADYPFTTLEPNLGVVSYGEHSYVVADIPGLIEGASEGKGLGIKFLKHIERTKAFVHLVDCSWCLNPFEALESYVTVRQELEQYGQKLLDKREIICLTKTDAMREEEIQEYADFFEEQLDKKVLPLSSVSSKNVEVLKSLMLRSLDN